MKLAEFAMILGRLPGQVAVAQHEAMGRAVDVVKEEAQAVIGQGYDYPASDRPAAYAPDAAWAGLAPATVADRVANGFPADEPLLRTGQLRDSIESRVEQGFRLDVEGVVGSDDEIAVYQELGTGTIPPRPFLGGAAFHKKEEVVEILGHAVAVTIAGQKV